MKINWNNNWTFQKEGQKEIRVNLPYDAMLQEVRDPNCAGGTNSGYFPGGKYRYAKVFELSAEDVTKKIFVHFENVYQNCRVSLNGTMLREHHYGYSCFDVDLTPAVKEGKNEIEVLVDNTLQPNCRWYSGSGIYRDVTLYIVDNDYISECHTETLSIDPAIIRVSARTMQDSPLSVEVLDQGVCIVKGELGEITIPNARLWSEKDPYLYEIRVSSEKDEVRFFFGIRKLEWSAEKGLCVNGESVLLRGACLHHDHGILGANEYYDAEYRRMKILKENGFNAIRFAHNPASQIQLDICDRLGIYAMNEAFDGWYTPKTYHDYSRHFMEDWKEDLTALVKSSYNHPSVILYSIGNEITEPSDNKGVEMAKQMRDLVHRLDPGRPVTAGINVLLNVYTRMGFGIYKEKGEYKAEPLENIKGYKEQKTGSTFFNATAQKLGKLIFFVSKGRKGDAVTSMVAPALDIVGLNYASSRYDIDAKKYPERMMVGSETMAMDLPYNWERVKKYPQLIGDFVWSGWDYLGEACFGDWTYASYPGYPLLAGQGMIDICGKPLASMAYMQVVWGLRSKPFICVRPLNHNHEVPHKGSWQFTNAIDSYSWDGYENESVYCEVYGAGESVTLYLNGKEIGTKKYKDYKTHFIFPYEAGELRAVSKDGKGQIAGVSSLSSGKKETKLRITPEKTEIRAGELVYLNIAFTDCEGNLKPYVEEEVTVKVSENLKLLGLGSALCKSDEVFTDHRHRTYRGSALAVVSAKSMSGEYTITVTSQNHGSASVTLKSGGEQ